MWFCDECGAATVGGDPARADPPSCADHGPRWRLVRNAPCAEAIVVDPDGRVLLGRRAKAPMQGRWEIPGGFVDRGEHSAEAAVRELREEMGIDIVLTGLVGTYLETASNGECLAITAYTARTESSEVRPDPAEVSEWAWVSPTDFPAEMAGRDRERLRDWVAGRTVPLPADGLAPPD